MALPAGASAARALYASGHHLDYARRCIGATLWIQEINTLVRHVRRLFGFGVGIGAGAHRLRRPHRRRERARLLHDRFELHHADEHRQLSSAVGTSYIETGAHERPGRVPEHRLRLQHRPILRQDGDEALTGTLQSERGRHPVRRGPGEPDRVEWIRPISVSSTPGIPIYAGPEGTWVFTVPFGSGEITYLAWDLCCAERGDPPYRWMTGTESSTARSTSRFAIDSITRNKEEGSRRRSRWNASCLFPADVIVALGKDASTRLRRSDVISKSVGAGQAQLLDQGEGQEEEEAQGEAGKVTLSVAINTGGGEPRNAVCEALAD